MRTIILYTSSVGNTKKYAEDLASSIGADVLPLKKFKWKNISNYDCFVYGGWVRGGTIMGLNDFLAHYDDLNGKDILVYSVGMSFVTPDTRKAMISSNILDLYHVRYYQLRGSFDFKKLNFFNKLLMINSLNAIAKDPNATPDQTSLLDIKEKPFDYYDHEGIEKMAAVVRKIDAEKKIIDA